MAKEVTVVELNDKPEYQRLLAGSPQTHGIKVGRVHLAPEAECGLHNTENREEVLVFLSGHGQAFIEDNAPLEVGQGKVTYIPPNTDHNIKNTGTEPLIYVFCVTPVEIDND